MIKTKVAFFEVCCYPASQSNLKSFHKALIGWKKPALQKVTFALIMWTGCWNIKLTFTFHRSL